MEDVTSPGYQGSETTRVEVDLYTHGEGFLQTQYEGRRIALSDRGTGLKVTRVHTTKALGAAAGVFSVEVSARTAEEETDLRDLVRDDDWIDITFTKHNKPYHSMRGLIDTITRRSTTSPNGSTMTRYMLTGRDFGKIFEQQTIWFDRITRGNYAAAAASRIWSENESFANGKVDQVVRALLLSFLVPANNQGGGLWIIPNSLAVEGGGVSGASFHQTLQLYMKDFSNIPARSSAINPSYFSIQSPNLWALAQEWSDPALCELFVDLAKPSGHYLDSRQECRPRDTVMTVFLRDRPFPNAERDGAPLQAPYFNLPLHVVARQGVHDMSLTRSGRERKNAFFMAPALMQEIAAGFIDLQLPLVHPDDIRKHGMRRMDAFSRYISANGEDAYLGYARKYRNIIRDMHCMNHLWFNGTITLNHGRPDIRIGSRLRIPGRSQNEDETYYVEHVNQDWLFEQGLKTTVGVTRGWRGTDASLASTLERIRNEYTIAEPAALQAGQLTDGELAPPTLAVAESINVG